MAQQPLDYSINAPEAYKSVLSGFQTGININELQLQQKAKELEMQRRQELQVKINALADNPNPTAKDYANVALFMPKNEADSLRSNFELLNKEQKDNELRFGGQVVSAFSSKSPQVGLKLLRERAEAERNSGKEDRAQAYETWAKIAEIDPTTAQKSIGVMLASLPGGDKVLEASIKALKAPGEVKKVDADAFVAELEARYKPAKLAADLQISQEQAKQLKAGMMPLEKRPEAEAKFRKEYSDQTKSYQDVKSAYGRIQSADKSGAGDIALIFNYMKMLDPGSVVREGEFATAENAGGAFAKAGNLYNKLLTGERLKDEQRNMFVKQSERLYQSAAGQEKVVRSGIERIATGYGLKPENIFYESVETAPTAPGATVSVGGKTYTRPANFTDAQWSAYKQSVGAQ
jgi:hypothetical protein